jgi:hypothetical protein
MGEVTTLFPRVRPLLKGMDKIEKEMAEPEFVREALKWIIEGYASGQNFSHQSHLFGLARNEAVRIMVQELNNLQKELAFMDGFEVVYKTKEQGG